MTARLIASTLLALALFGASAGARAQVNTERLRTWNEGGISGYMDFTGNLRTGNVDSLSLASGVRIQHAVVTATTAEQPEPRLRNLVYFVGEQGLGILSDDRYKNVGFAHARWTRVWWRPLSTEVFGQAQYNEFLSLERRFLLGGGVRLGALELPHVDLAAGVGYMLELEQVDVPEGATDEPSTVAHRSTNYISVNFHFDEPDVNLSNTVYVQPRWTEPSDFRILNDAELSVSVTNQLSFVLATSIWYDSRPVTGVERLDTNWTHRIRIDF